MSDIVGTRLLERVFHGEGTALSTRAVFLEHSGYDDGHWENRTHGISPMTERPLDCTILHTFPTVGYNPALRPVHSAAQGEDQIPTQPYASSASNPRHFSLIRQAIG